MHDAKLIYDAAAEMQPCNWFMYIEFVIVIFCAVVGFIVVLAVGTDPETRIIATKITLFVLEIFAFVVFVPDIIMNAHEWAMRATVRHGDYLTVTGKLANVRSEFILVGKGDGVSEFDVLTLNQGSSFELKCGHRSKELPGNGRPYGCLDADVGDDLTIDSSGSLGMRGSVPALRVWRMMPIK